MNTKKMRLTGVVLAMGLSGAAQAALESRLDGLAVYDTDLNITWLANANLAATNTFGVSGIGNSGAMTWYTTQSWIGAMNAASYLGYDNWMLPNSPQTDASCPSLQSTGSSYGCTGSQMGHLFYSEFDPGVSPLSDANPGYSLFSNIQRYGPNNLDFYWSSIDGVQFASAMLFSMYAGFQGSTSSLGTYRYAWAVLPGDVALACTDPTCVAGPITSVPEPEAFGLMLAGLGLVGWAARRHRTPAKQI